MSAEPHLSVLIVNYNGERFLDACLESVRRHLRMDHEIVVVDNASSDGSVERLRTHHPDVRVVVSPVNGGFAAGNNLGARVARGRYLLLLNNDTVVESPLDPMVGLMDREPGLGALGCSLVYADGRRQESIGLEHSAGRLLLSWAGLQPLLPGNLARRTLSALDPAYAAERVPAHWVSGACLLTRRTLWERLGGLDERYFMYVEDTDYCRRVRQAGAQVAYSACSRVTHFEGAGRAWRGRGAIVQSARSYRIYAEKFLGPAGQLAWRTLLPMVFLLRAAAYRLVHALGRDPFGAEKASAFREAAGVLVRHQPRQASISS